MARVILMEAEEETNIIPIPRIQPEVELKEQEQKEFQKTISLYLLISLSITTIFNLVMFISSLISNWVNTGSFLMDFTDFLTNIISLSILFSLVLVIYYLPRLMQKNFHLLPIFLGFAGFLIGLILITIENYLPMTLYLGIHETSFSIFLFLAPILLIFAIIMRPRRKVFGGFDFLIFLLSFSLTISLFNLNSIFLVITFLQAWPISVALVSFFIIAILHAFASSRVKTEQKLDFQNISRIKAEKHHTTTLRT